MPPKLSLSLDVENMDPVTFLNSLIIFLLGNTNSEHHLVEQSSFQITDRLRCG